MSELTARDLAWMFNGGSDRRGVVARQMRNEEMPSWMEEAFKTLEAKKNDPTIKANGEQHTIESMVQDLRERVQLDILTKQADPEPIKGKEKIAAVLPPLFVRATDEDADRLLAAIADYISRHFLMPGHGQSQLPALFEAVKEKFGVDGVSRAGGINRVKEMLEKLKSEHEAPNPAQDLPRFTGQPTPLGNETQEQKDSSDFLTQDTTKQT